MKLFCFPCAGATASTYLGWQKLFPSLTLIAAEMPGHGTRSAEALPESFEHYIVDALSFIGARTQDEEPYALWGHSMGALLAWEVTRCRQASGERLPVHLFLSGRHPPHIHKPPIWYPDIADDELLFQIFRLGGFPRELLGDAQLQSTLIALLKADIRNMEAYEYPLEPSATKVPATCFSGSHDLIASPEDMSKWQSHCVAGWSQHIYPGDHFYYREHLPKLANIMLRTLGAKST